MRINLLWWEIDIILSVKIVEYLWASFHPSDYLKLVNTFFGRVDTGGSLLFKSIGRILLSNNNQVQHIYFRYILPGRKATGQILMVIRLSQAYLHSFLKNSTTIFISDA